MAFYIINHNPTFVEVKLKDKTVTVPAGGKVGPFRDGQETSELLNDISRGTVAAERIDQQPIHATPKKKSKSEKKETIDDES